MLSCEEMTEVCSAELERTLRWGERLSLRTHLMMCTGCTNYREQLHELRRITRAYAEGRAATGEAGSEATDR